MRIILILTVITLLSCNKQHKVKQVKEYKPKYIIGDTLKYNETLEKLLIARPNQSYDHLRSICFDMYKIKNKSN